MSLRERLHASRRLSAAGASMEMYLELTIPDLHLGKLAWGHETGHGDYDVRIAERTFETAVAALIERTLFVQV